MKTTILTMLCFFSSLSFASEVTCEDLTQKVKKELKSVEPLIKDWKSLSSLHGETLLKPLGLNLIQELEARRGELGKVCSDQEGSYIYGKFADFRKEVEKTFVSTHSDFLKTDAEAIADISRKLEKRSESRQKRSFSTSWGVKGFITR